ncbi:hypothetical protein Tco_1365974 [Tanacetum coccineum]
MKIIGYQGSVDKVSAFYTKNLAQPWQTIFKFFNRCLTSRKSGYDQPKINILLIFHAVINQVHVDYVDLLCVYTTGNVTVKEMPIPDDLLIDAIRETQVYKEFVRVDVPTIQPQPVESTQGAKRTPRATKTPNPAAVDDVVSQKEKGKRIAGETS